MKTSLNLVIFLFCFFVNPPTIFAQAKKKIIVYTDDNPHMFPFIEKTLIGLKHTNERLIFSKVINLTRIIENEIDEQITTESQGLLSKESFLSKDIPISERLVLAKRISEFDYFLKINILTIGEVIEFQFFLYNILEKQEKDNAGSSDFILRIANDVQNPSEMESFFINPKAENYEEKIRLNISKLFPSSNHLPVAKLTANGLVNPENIYLSVNDTLFLSASFSSDKDSKNESFQYNWNQIDYYNRNFVPDSLRLPIKNGREKQEIPLIKTGSYLISLSINDGIGESKKIYIRIHVLYPPVILLTDSRKFFSNMDLFNGPDTFKFNLLLDYYVFYNLSNLKFQIIRKNKREIYGTEKLAVTKIHEDLLNSKMQNYFYPDVIDFETVKEGEKTNLKIDFEPHDAKLGYNNYNFNVYGDYKGIKTKIGKLNIKYYKFGKNNLRILYDFPGTSIDDNETEFQEDNYPSLESRSLEFGKDSIRLYSKNPITLQYTRNFKNWLDFEISIFNRAKVNIKRWVRFSNAPTVDSKVNVYQEEEYLSLPQLGLGIFGRIGEKNELWFQRTSIAIRPYFKNIFKDPIYSYSYTSGNSNDEDEIKEFVIEKLALSKFKKIILYPSINFDYSRLIPKYRTSILLGMSFGFFKREFVGFLRCGISHNF